jgi:hypothetical protein
VKLDSTTTIEAPPSAMPGPPAPSAMVRLARALFSFQVLLALGLATVTVCTVSNRFHDPDLWWHLKAGEIVWDTHSIPSKDLFSFTAYGQPSMEHEWLAQWSIYGAYKLGGYTALMLWLGILASLLFVLVYLLCYLSSKNSLVAFLGGLCAWFFGTVSLAIRPLLLGHIFLVVELILLTLAARNRRWLWLLPPLFAVWVNCHGSFFFGLGILCAYWVCSGISGRWGLVVAERWDRPTRRTLDPVVALCAIALCCNPVGIDVFLYPLKVLGQQSTSMAAIDEWLPPDLRSARGIGIIAAMLGLLLFPLVCRTQLRMREMVTVAMAFGLAILHARMLFVFGIVVSPVLCRLLSPVLEERRGRDHPVPNALFMFAFLAAMIWTFPGAARIQKQIRQSNPTGAVDYIRRAGLSGPMLNDYGFGAYLIWVLPQHKVFIDGRGDVFDPTGILAEYGRWATLAEDPNLLLEKHGIRFCLLSKNAPMAQVLPYLPGWHRAYSDDLAALYVR